MQSTLDRKVIYLMLRAARRQEAERRQATERRQAAARRRKPAAGALPARLTDDGWWLNAPEAALPPHTPAGPPLAIVDNNAILPAKVTADE
jgi:hypothetical protein